MHRRNDADVYGETDALLDDNERGAEQQESRGARITKLLLPLCSPSTLRPLEQILAATALVLFLIICLLCALLFTPPILNPHYSENGAVCDTAECVYTAHGILAALNETVDPCDNFYEFATGGWRAQHAIPEGAGVYGIEQYVAEKNAELMDRIMGDTSFGSSFGPADRSNLAKLRTFYDGCMDTDAADSAGAQPLLTELQELHRVLTSKKEPLTTGIQWLHERAIPVFFEAAIDGDPGRAPSAATPTIMPGGLGLPDPSLYNDRQILSAYQAAITEAALLVHPSSNTTAFESLAREVASFEHELSRIHADEAPKISDPLREYNPLGLQELHNALPSVNWELYMDRMSPEVLPHKAIVTSVRYLERLEYLISNTPRRTLHAYMYWALARKAGLFLGPNVPLYRVALRVANIVTGKEPDAQQERKKTCAASINTALGYMYGRYFVREAFSADAKVQVEEMLENIIRAFSQRLPALSWLDKATRAAARDKAAGIVLKIGYPTYPDSMSGLGMKRWYEDLNVTGHLFADQMAARRFLVRREWSFIGDELNAGALGDLTTAEVNAEYIPSQNEIVIPAGQIQPPYFDPSWPEYLQYGALGSAAGHELSHAFDPSGRHYDAQGFLRNWWTPTASAEFTKRQRCFEEQYGNYTIPDGRGGELPLNSRFTVGEDVADAGGLAQSYAAWRTLMRHGGYERRRLNKRLPGLLRYTREQLFFIAYGMSWARIILSGEARLRLQTDPHSPSEYRVNGVLRNAPEFAAAFGCSAGSRMVLPPTERCAIW